MKKTWIFFKLRMLQLKSDKTALFFCYVLPVLLLVAVGYPLDIKTENRVVLHYLDDARNIESRLIVDGLSSKSIIDMKEYLDEEEPFQAISSNEVQRILLILPKDDKPNTGSFVPNIEPSMIGEDELSTISLHLIQNDIDENHIENEAVSGILGQVVTKDDTLKVDRYTFSSDRLTSYIVTLLPGLIGLTLMIIGFNGFGSVLIEEEHHGLFKNIKTIDVSPVPFLAGLLLSRLLLCYSVAAALCLVSSVIFDISFHFNFFLFFIFITLGSVAFLGVGLVMATISPSVAAFSGIVNFTQMPFIILGGVFFSVNLFPDWLKYISMVIPLTQFNIALQKVLFEPNTISEIAGMKMEISVLVAWCVSSLYVSYLKFRW